MQLLFLTSLLAVGANAHGVLLMVKGANGVTAPGSCVMDGTPRNCIVNACGAQADTAIIRDEEMRTHKFGALGWTQGGGDCKPDAVIGEYMGLGQAPRYTGGGKSTGKADDVPSEEEQNLRLLRRNEHVRHANELFQRQSFLHFPLIGYLGLGGKRTSYPVETIVGDHAGKGRDDGLPTTNDNGELDLVYRQINEDGPGPMAVTVDTSSAGADYNAFKSVQVLQNVPGDGFVGLSLGTNTNYPMKIKLAKDMVCEGKVAGLNNVCFVRIRNNAPAGPFGGAGFFTQSAGARKRATAYRLKKRMGEAKEE